MENQKDIRIMTSLVKSVEYYIDFALISVQFVWSIICVIGARAKYFLGAVLSLFLSVCIWIWKSERSV